MAITVCRLVLAGFSVGCLVLSAQAQAPEPPKDSTFWSTPGGPAQGGQVGGGSQPGAGRGDQPPADGSVAPVVVVTMAPAPPMSKEQLEGALRAAKPIESKLAVNPMVDMGQLAAKANADAAAGRVGAPLVFDGKNVVTMRVPGVSGQLPSQGPPIAPAAASPSGGISAQNYGSLSYNSAYMYNDRIARLPKDYDQVHTFETSVGVFTGTFPGQSAPFRCSAALIAPSIIVTAARCAHTGGAAGAYATNLTFAPGRYVSFQSIPGTSGTAPAVVSPWGAVPIINGAVAAGWRSGSTGILNTGVDVALFGVDYQTGTTTPIGIKAGYLGFCFANCLQNLWAISGYGYPKNYGVTNIDAGLRFYFVGGETLHESHSLGLSSGFDYTFGTGMNSGGAIGGPYITNPDGATGDPYDTGADRGQYFLRNVIFAVRSWGYDTAFDSYKIGGASPLSGTGVDNNNFKAMYNAVCAQVRAAQTVDSCALIP